jgi:DAK2 domain fusion protein YloV
MSDFPIPPDLDGRRLAKMSLLDGQGLMELIIAGMTWLKTNQQLVNSLNVFPVPDGDTGTNMLLTMQAAYNEIASSGEKNVGKMAHSIAQGALMGARGNSGVILSQLFRGFARSLDTLDTADAPAFVKALNEAKTTAYKGVVRPVEGTILTVAKDLASAAEASLVETQDMNVILERIVTAADISVKHTPELLPILKQAGVVDAGGKGLFFLLEGMLRYLNGQSLETSITTVLPLASMHLENAMENIEPGQDFEVVIDFRPQADLDLENMVNHLLDIGTSIQVGEGDGMYRMHIHVPTEKRYDPIDYIMGLGTITKVSMENLLAQMDQSSVEHPAKLHFAPVEPGQIAVIAVSPGLGISRIFASLGVAAIVEGGQTMNPSTLEIIHAFENLPTDRVIILPDNKNIIMAAQSACSMTVKKVAVVPSFTVPQGLSAMLRLNPEGDFESVVKEMTNALEDVDTGEITIATRSVEINGVDVHQGEVISILNGKVVMASASLEDACLGLLENAKTKERERITLFYGTNISKNEVNKIVDKIRAAYPSHEIELHEGGQPHYQFIIAIE